MGCGPSKGEDDEAVVRKNPAQSQANYQDPDTTDPYTIKQPTLPRVNSLSAMGREENQINNPSFFYGGNDDNQGDSKYSREEVTVNVLILQEDMFNNALGRCDRETRYPWTDK